MQEESILFIENHLIHCIQRILSPSISVDISHAEEQLVEYQRKYFILNSLWNIVVNIDLELNIRILAAIYLKNTIESQCRKYEKYAGSLNWNEKEHLKDRLLYVFQYQLPPQISKLMNIVIAKIALLDYPSHWPLLLDTLLKEASLALYDSPTYFENISETLYNIVKLFSNQYIIGGKKRPLEWNLFQVTYSHLKKKQFDFIILNYLHSMTKWLKIFFKIMYLFKDITTITQDSHSNFILPIEKLYHLPSLLTKILFFFLDSSNFYLLNEKTIILKDKIILQIGKTIIFLINSISPESILSQDIFPIFNYYLDYMLNFSGKVLERDIRTLFKNYHLENLFQILTLGMTFFPFKSESNIISNTDLFIQYYDQDLNGSIISSKDIGQISFITRCHSKNLFKVLFKSFEAEIISIFQFKYQIFSSELDISRSIEPSLLLYFITNISQIYPFISNNMDNLKFVVESAVSLMFQLTASSFYREILLILLYELIKQNSLSNIDPYIYWNLFNSLNFYLINNSLSHISKFFVFRILKCLLKYLPTTQGSYQISFQGFYTKYLELFSQLFDSDPKEELLDFLYLMIEKLPTNDIRLQNEFILNIWRLSTGNLLCQSKILFLLSFTIEKYNGCTQEFIFTSEAIVFELMTEESLEATSPLLDEYLNLWHQILKYSLSLSDQMKLLYPKLHSMIELIDDSHKIIFLILRSYILFKSSFLFEKYEISIFTSLCSKLEEMNPELWESYFTLVATFTQIYPHLLDWISPILEKSLRILLDNSYDYVFIEPVLNIFSRYIITLYSSPSSHSDNIFYEKLYSNSDFWTIWLENFDSLSLLMNKIEALYAWKLCMENDNVHCIDQLDIFIHHFVTILQDSEMKNIDWTVPLSKYLILFYETNIPESQRLIHIFYKEIIYSYSMVDIIYELLQTLSYILDSSLFKSSIDKIHHRNIEFLLENIPKLKDFFIV